MPSILCFDTETTGLADFKASPSAPHQPHVIEFGCLFSPTGSRDDTLPMACLLNIEDAPFDPKALEVNGLSPALWKQHGISPALAVNLFGQLVMRSDLLLGHNIEFDIKMMLCAAAKVGKLTALEQALQGKPTYCTKQHSTSICKLPNTRTFGGPYKWPTLAEAYAYFYDGRKHSGHRAMKDVHATWDVYWAIQNFIARAGAEPAVPPASDNPYQGAAKALDGGYS